MINIKFVDSLPSHSEIDYPSIYLIPESSGSFHFKIIAFDKDGTRKENLSTIPVYRSKEEAFENIPEELRQIGTTVNIMSIDGNGTLIDLTPYWWKLGTSNQQLIPIISSNDLKSDIYTGTNIPLNNPIGNYNANIESGEIKIHDEIAVLGGRAYLKHKDTSPLNLPPNCSIISGIYKEDNVNHIYFNCIKRDANPLNNEYNVEIFQEITQKETKTALQFNGVSSRGLIDDNNLWDIEIGDEIFIEFEPETQSTYDLLCKSKIALQNHRWAVNNKDNFHGFWLQNTNVVDLRMSGLYPLEKQVYQLNINSVAGDNLNCDLIQVINGTSYTNRLEIAKLPSKIENRNRLTIGAGEDGGLMRYFKGKIFRLRKNDDLFDFTDLTLGATQVISSKGTTLKLENVSIVEIA